MLKVPEVRFGFRCADEPAVQGQRERSKQIAARHPLMSERPVQFKCKAGKGVDDRGVHLGEKRSSTATDEILKGADCCAVSLLLIIV